MHTALPTEDQRLMKPFRIYLRACALVAGQDPDRLSLPDGVLLATMLVKTDKAPTFDEYYGISERGDSERRSPRYSLDRVGNRVRTSGAETAEDIELMLKMGWGRRGS